MKNIVLGLMSFALMFGFFAVANVSAAKPAGNNCATIQDGALVDTKGNPITLGYDQWGYNYQAKMFNGWYDNFSRPTTPATDGDSLMMKWNDAWLSNQDCYGDGKLDRHFGFPAYVGSGAWLTNHASGAYESSTNYHWDVAGSWVIAVNNGTYPHDYKFTMTSLPDGTFTGVGGYPAGGSYVIDEVVTNGQITGDSISFTASYYQNGLPTGYVWNATGTIAPDGSMSGVGDAGVFEWHSTSGTATKVGEMCTWSDFVKIVAVPADANEIDGYWFTPGSVKIGPSIWGEFAIIQEVSEDPCGEFNLADYKSELRSGLGNW